MLDLLHELEHDPDGYWIAYDVKLQSESSDIDSILPPHAFTGGDGSYSGNSHKSVYYQDWDQDFGVNTRFCSMSGYSSVSSGPLGRAEYFI